MDEHKKNAACTYHKCSIAVNTNAQFGVTVTGYYPKSLLCVPQWRDVLRELSVQKTTRPIFSDENGSTNRTFHLRILQEFIRRKLWLLLDSKHLQFNVFNASAPCSKEQEDNS